MPRPASASASPSVRTPLPDTSQTPLPESD